ncbi:MAG: sporulation protein [Myxococcales bacterium]|nr:sporulation protein [Myxococcales bacterium]
MGLLSMLFGGGTSLDLRLDAGQTVPGGQISGTVTVHGGKKDLRITAVKVRLLYLNIDTSGEGLPKVDTTLLLDETIASDVPLAAKQTQEFEFRFRVPEDVELSGDGVSYTVQAAADIPKVKDPTADAKLEIVYGDGDTLALGLDAIYERWPALRDGQGEELHEALWNFSLECYSEREQLIAAEPVLSGYIRRGDPETREKAFEAWANLLDGQARKEHIKLLDELADQQLSDAMRDELIKAATKFAEEGALPLVKRFAASGDAEIRKQVAENLRFNAEDKFRGKKDLVLKLADDPQGEVRAAAYGALTAFNDEKKVVALLAERARSEGSAEAQAACVSALALAHHHGFLELTCDVYDDLLKRGSFEARKEIAEAVHWLPEEALPRVEALVKRLFADPDDEVRRTMAWQFRNMHDFKKLGHLLRHTIEHDSSEEVRIDGLGGLGAVMEPGELVAYYRSWMGREDTSEVRWAVLSGLRDHHSDKTARALLGELARSDDERLATAAQEELDREDDD